MVPYTLLISFLKLMMLLIMLEGNWLFDTILLAGRAVLTIFESLGTHWNFVERKIPVAHNIQMRITRNKKYLAWIVLMFIKATDLLCNFLIDAKDKWDADWIDEEDFSNIDADSGDLNAPVPLDTDQGRLQRSQLNDRIVISYCFKLVLAVDPTSTMIVLFYKSIRRTNYSIVLEYSILFSYSP